MEFIFFYVQFNCKAMNKCIEKHDFYGIFFSGTYSNENLLNSVNEIVLLLQQKKRIK
jgi:hypothetical protein